MGLRVGVVGCGWHATRTTYPALSAAEFEVRACCARHLDRAEATARRVGAPAAYDDVGRMLAERAAEMDAVVLVLPPDGYEGPALACLAAGLPVFCEKPAALDSAALRRMEEAAGAAGRALMVGYPRRFAPPYERARELLGDPRFGDAVAYQAHWSMGPRTFPSLDYFVRENAVHQLDLARFLLGEVSEVLALTAVRDGRHAVAASLRFASGAVATLGLDDAGSWDHVNEWVSVAGDRANVVVDNLESCSFQAAGEPELRWSPNFTTPVPANSSLRLTGFVGGLEHFAAVVREGAPCRSDVASARRTTELAEAVLAAAGA
jgi:UDP-N-acetylglucosamine 3-dehydrogenase